VNESRTAEDTSLATPDRWVELYGDYLFKHALARLRHPEKAEDVVQETFLVALKAGNTFAGRATAKSWLLGILKNKIYDYYRKVSRETPFTDLEFYSVEENESFTPRGLAEGGWIDKSRPVEWQEPGASLDQDAFWKAFQDCAKKMPRKITAAFTLREVDGVESKEICSILGISEKNLWVMLHRARMALRKCLETNWFKI
jgi:RNA polymerase sigma-70 factor (ECF subfamily)